MPRESKGPRASGLGPRPAVVALALIACLACRSHAPSAASKAGKVIATAMAAADRAKAPWRCTGADRPGLRDEQLGNGWHAKAHLLVRDEHGDNRASDGSGLVIGVIADAGDAAPATLAALAHLRAKFDEAHADVVLALGGMGQTQQALEATLGVLAEHAKFPVVALPGDLEPTAALVAAVAALRARGAVVVDGRLVERVELRGVAIATVPGAGAQARLVPGAEGCAWNAPEVAKIYGDLAGAPGLRVIAAAEAPRAEVGGEPAGEPALVPAPAQIDVVLHGPTREAPTPARSGTRDGRGVALSPGTADATARLPDPHAPSAGTLHIRGDTWTWKPIVDTR